MSKPAAWLLVVLLVGGCTERSPVATFTMEPGQSPGGSLVDGNIGGVDGCIVLVTPGQQPMALLFDSRYTVTYPPLKIFDPSGTLVAEGGQHVWLGVQGNKKSNNPNCNTARALWVFSVSTKDPVAD